VNSHLSDDQLVDRLYGISDAGSEHLDACPECQMRWSRMQERHHHAADYPVASNQQLRKQRRQILNRMSEPAPVLRLMWAPATAALVLVVGLAITPPKVHAPVLPEPVIAEAIEAGWFEDIYSATRVIEPRAATPIRELFFLQGVAE
jgi:anti-sigma factor RsiW